MNLRLFLATAFAYFMSLPLQARADEAISPVKDKKNVLIFRASDSLLRFSKNSESYRLGGGFQRRLPSGHVGSFQKSLGTYLEYQSNKYGDSKSDRILRAYVGLQVDYIKPKNSLDGVFMGIYPALAMTQGQAGSQKVNSTVGGILLEVGKSFQLGKNILYRPTIGYRNFAGAAGEVLLRPLEFAIEF
jgi:hypothetical protein